MIKSGGAFIKTKEINRKTQKMQIAVLMGGPSSEHRVSLHSGKMVLAALSKRKYLREPVVISKNGKWPISLSELKRKFDVAFIAMHGEYGEDGTVQKILEAANIPYTGSSSQASALGMNKIKSARLFRKNGLLVPKFVLWPKSLTLPIVVKPVDRGSSVGVKIVKKQSQLEKAIKNALRYSSRIMIQQYIPGREFTCGVLEIGSKLVPLVPTEIIPKNRVFFDYRTKYTKDAALEITPPRLPSRLIEKIRNAALKAHKAIGAKGFSRTDFILSNIEGRSPKLYVLEINTIPGLTTTSLFPQQAKAAGISFSKMLDYIIESALRNSAQKRRD